jgi:hypothetical protein
MRPLCCFLLASILAAQAPGPGLEGLPDHWSALGADPVAGIQLTPPGCWDGLLLGATRGTAKRRSGSEATVEVWDLLPPGSPRREAFSLYLGGLRERLSRAFAQPPPKLQALELNDIMQSDPSQPQKLDLTKVKAMQERFNRLPPNRSTVR